MTTRFSQYAFKASPTISPLNGYALADRTMPARLNDVIDVKDFGAIGDGAADDTDAINHAIDYAYQMAPDPTWPYGTTVFFPPGTYFIGSPPLVWDRNPTLTPPGHKARILYMGAGRGASVITGTYWTGGQIYDTNNSFLTRAGRFTAKGNCDIVGLRDLSIFNLSTGALSGALNMEASGIQFFIRNCHFKGMVALSACGNVFGNGIHDCLFECTQPPTAADAATRSP